MIPNFRVPTKSIIFNSFYRQMDRGDAIENLNWWEASSGTRLQDRQVRVQVKNMGESVQALVTPIV